MTIGQAAVRPDVQPEFPGGTSAVRTTAEVSAPVTGQSPTLVSSLLAQVASAWKWIEQKRIQQITGRRLKVAETVSLGEKRFVSILQVDGEQFLIGGSAGQLSLLAIMDQRGDSSSTSWRQAATGEEPR